MTQEKEFAAFVPPEGGAEVFARRLGNAVLNPRSSAPPLVPPLPPREQQPPHSGVVRTTQQQDVLRQPSPRLVSVESAAISCAYFVKTGGKCRFGAGCKFLHPALPTEISKSLR